MPQTAIGLDAHLRSARIMWAVMLIAQVGYVAMAEYLSHPQPPPDNEFEVAMVAVALVLAVTAIVIRSKMFAPAAEILRTNSSDAGALQRWRKGQVISFVLAECVVLLGFTTRFVGVPRAHAAPLYAVGVGMMVFFYPQRP